MSDAAAVRDTTVVRPRRNPGARRILFCLGFCGGGTGAYLPWTAAVPDDTELAAICYPGREGRFTEEFAADWEELVQDSLSAVLSAADRPYVLFGHSLGGWMAFDLAVRIKECGGRAPDSVVVSSANSPRRQLDGHDMWPNSPREGHSDAELMGWMQSFGLIPQHALDDPDLREMALDLMRADLHVRDSFTYRAGSALDVPLQLFTGESDEVIEPNTADHWRELARGGFRHDVLPGSHFYTPQVWASLPGMISALGSRQGT
ncbi:thioesterase II family protein [Peterkaempfera sp. SMS 1(5)a]|uniref:thioesterase II family protein n=1 Tax=Peterkaempfera podocarpi TaxID=3232308 RepID=UPI00366C8E44